MRRITTVAFATLLSLVGASSAFAGTEAFNSYKDTNEYGYRFTDIDVNQVNYEFSDITSTTIKLEADGGNRNKVSIEFDGHEFTGDATSRGGDNPVVYGTTTTENTWSDSFETVNVNTTESVTFDSSDYTHTVGSGQF